MKLVVDALRSAEGFGVVREENGRIGYAKFVKEAEKDFVGTVVLETRAERVRAFEFLDRMAMADGDYSAVELACIAALAQKVKAGRDTAIAERYSRAARFDR